VVPGRESGKWTTVLGWAVAKWVAWGRKKRKKGKWTGWATCGERKWKEKKEEEWAACQIWREKVLLFSKSFLFLGLNQISK
jgi:hypothetical protein